MSTPKRDEPIEWVCGLDPDPTRDGKGLARDFLVVWLRDGRIIDGGIIGPALTRERIVASYRATTLDPKADEPHVPDRIRVASPEVAEMLRAGVDPGVEVVAAPTPEFDAFQEKIEQDKRRRVRDDGSGETYLGPGVLAGSVRRFFAFAAGLYRAAPWEHVPYDACLVGVTCEGLGLDGAVISVLGQDGTSKGFLLFASHAIFLEFMATDFDAKGPVRVPPHLALTYERGADLSAQRRKEISAYGFEVVDAGAYPSLMVLDGLLPRAPENDDLVLVGAVASALTGLVRHVPDLRGAWSGKAALATFRVQTTKGKLEMTLSAPHDAAEKARRGLAEEVQRWEKKR